MENRIVLDQEIDVPISLIDYADWNPKSPISGTYRRGLQASLSYYGQRDRLKIYPHPTIKGRYICLDGNQRVDVISEHVLNQKIKSKFQLEENASQSALDAIKSDPANLKEIEKLKKSLSSHKIPCQVITKLDADQKLSLSDAKLFTAAYNRNVAKYDEIKQADLYREILSDRLKTASDSSKKIIESSIKSMVRPELPVVASVQPSQETQPTFQFDAPGSFTPTEENPWGANPPEPTFSAAQTPSSPSIQFVPLVFSLTPEGYKSITDSILRSKARMFREVKLKAALENLEKILSDNLDDIIDSTVVETALTILSKHQK